MTSKEYYKKYYTKDGYHWRTSGIHAYNVLKKFEDEEKKKELTNKKGKKDNSKFKDWIK